MKSGRAEAESVLSSLVTEKAFLQAIRDEARLCGWATYHPYRSDRSEPGWPDLVLLKPPFALFVELKAEKGKLSEHQRRWLCLLRDCGLNAQVWRPSQRESITAVLELRVPR